MSALLLLATVLIGASPGGVWEELEPLRDPPAAVEVPPALWFEGDPSTAILLELDAGDAPLVWRVDVDADGHPLSLVEQQPVPLGDGRFVVFTSPAPSSPWAVVAPGGGIVRIHRLRPASPGAWPSTRRLRVDGTPRGWTWSLRGPGELVVRVRAVGGDALRAAPFDLVVEGPDADARLFSSSTPRDDGPWRRLSLPVGSGRQVWTAAAAGAELDLQAQLVRARPPFLRGPAAGEDPSPDVRALVELAQDQSRHVPGDADRAALPVLEAEVRRRDSEGPDPAPRTLRDAARHAWLQTTAFVATDIQPPAGAREVLAILPSTSQGPDERGRYPLGMAGFLPPGETVDVQLPENPGDPGQWAVVRGLGVNGHDRPLVASIEVDGGAPTRVLLQPGWTSFRLALEPGRHALRLSLPRGAEDGAGIAVDLPTSAPGRALGGTHARLVRAAVLRPGDVDGRFELPAAAGSAHLRVDAWWPGDGPRELRVHTPDGQRRVVVYPGRDVPVLMLESGDLLTAGTAAVDLPASAPWVRVEVVDDGPVWLRITSRQPYPRTVPGTPVSLTELPAVDDDLAGISARIARAADDPEEQAELRQQRATLLLRMGLAGYARRDVEAAAALAANRSGTIARLRLGCRAVADHVTVNRPPEGGVAALDLPAAVGHGEPAWLDDLAADDPAVLVSGGRLDDIGDSSAAHLARAQAAREDALVHPRAALLALAHARLAGEVVEEASANRIAGEAVIATRPDPLGIAASSPQRVILAGQVEAPDVDEDPAGWARWTLLGASLTRVDRVVAAGSQWVIALGRHGASEVTLEAFCDDLRYPPAEPTCVASVRVGRDPEQTWEIPRGEVATRVVRIAAGEEIAVGLAPPEAPGSAARHMAVGLSGEGWSIPGRRASFHVAWPGQPVVYRVLGPTVLEVETAARCGERPRLQLRVDGDAGIEAAWQETPPTLISDGGESFGPLQRHRLVLPREGVAELEARAEGGRVAVRVTQRMADSVVVPGAEVLPADPRPQLEVGEGEAAPSWSSVDLAARLPRPRFGTVDTGVFLWQRWSADEERGNRRYLYGEVHALHRVGLDRRTWLAGGLLARIGAGTPTVGVRLAATQRVPVVDLRLRGRLQGLAQAGDGAVHLALAVRASLDRPLRLGPDVWLVPGVVVRGYLQPPADASWGDAPADTEIASSYRRAHPFGLGAGVDLNWRPWVDGEWAVGVRARSNPDLSVDHAGAHAELRLRPRPLGLALRGDVSRRLADDWRHAAWWRTELTLRVWADLGPPALWIRPEVRLAYLVDPGRLGLTVGVSITPGRRAITHFAPTELLFEDIRAPELREGRWRR